MIDEKYVMIPLRLVLDLRDNPLALGLYALAGRLYLVHGAQIPLSFSDVRAYDPSLKVGAVQRAFDRLVGSGWLTRTLVTSGTGARVTPTWGVERDGTQRSWQHGAPRLGCPAQQRTLRLNRALLDVAIGRFTPHARGALVERYVTTPLRTLRQVGDHLLALSGLAGLRPTADDEALSETTWLAQLAATDPARLSVAGHARLDEHLPSTRVLEPPDSAADSRIGQGTAYRIGGGIGDRIGQQPEDTVSYSAVQRQRTSVAPPTNRTTGSKGILAIPGRSDSSCTPVACSEEEERPTLVMLTIAEERLRALGVFGTIAATFADMELATVDAAWQYVRSVPNLRDPAGVLVATLRRVRDEGWTIPVTAGQVDWRAVQQELYGATATQEYDVNAGLAQPSVADADAPRSPAQHDDTTTDHGSAQVRVLLLAAARGQLSGAAFMALSASAIVVTAGGVMITPPDPTAWTLLDRAGCSLAAIAASADCGAYTLVGPALPAPHWIDAAHWRVIPPPLQQALSASTLTADGDLDLDAVSYDLVRTSYADEVLDLLDAALVVAA